MVQPIPRPGGAANDKGQTRRQQGPETAIDPDQSGMVVSSSAAVHTPVPGQFDRVTDLCAFSDPGDAEQRHPLRDTGIEQLLRSRDVGGAHWATGASDLERDNIDQHAYRCTDSIDNIQIVAGGG